MKIDLTVEQASSIRNGVVQEVLDALNAKSPSKGKDAMLALDPSEWKWSLQYCVSVPDSGRNIHQALGLFGDKLNKTPEQLNQEWKDKKSRSVDERLDDYFSRVVGASIYAEKSRIFVRIDLDEVPELIRDSVRPKMEMEYVEDQRLLGLTPE